MWLPKTNVLWCYEIIIKFGGSGLGGGLVTVTFLCYTSWEIPILLLKHFGIFGITLERDTKVSK